MNEFSEEKMLFAAKYPFSKTAKQILQTTGITAEKTSYETKTYAKKALKQALEGKPFPFPGTEKQALLMHITSFPLTKIMVSCLENPKYYFYLANSVKKNTLNNLSKPNAEKELFALAEETQTRIETENNLIALSLSEFLSITSTNEMLKLVNQKTEKGKVWLSRNRFAHFLSEKAKFLVLTTLPVPLNAVPKSLSVLAIEALDETMQKKTSKTTTATLNAMPPCIEKLYSELLAGNSIPHMGRFALASFLAAINFPEESIIETFSNAPNYDEKTTRYQVSRLTGSRGGKRYSPLSCAKMQSYGFCPEKCGENSPLQYYKRHSKR